MMKSKVKENKITRLICIASSIARWMYLERCALNNLLHPNEIVILSHHPEQSSRAIKIERCCSRQTQMFSRLMAASKDAVTVEMFQTGSFATCDKNN